MTHGNTNSGTFFNCQLAADGSELITSLIAYANTKQICGFKITTSLNNQCIIGGTSCSVVFVSNWPEGQYLSYLEGRAGDIVDALRFVTITLTSTASTEEEK